MSTNKRDHASYLKSLIGELDERVYNLRLFDKNSEINAHCDDLVGQVTLTVESAMEHLKKVQDGLIDEINSYRTELIQTAGGTSISESEDWTSLAKDVEVLKHQEANDEVVKMAEDLKERARDLRRQLRASTFNESFMKFCAKELTQNDLVGKLRTSSKDTEDDLSIKQIDLGEMISKAQVFDLEPVNEEYYRVSGMYYLRDGNLAIAFVERPIVIWSTETNQKLFELTTDKKRRWSSVEFVQLPSGLLVSGSDEGEVDVWDLETRKHVMTMETFDKDGKPTEVFTLRALPNNRLLAFDGHFFIWDLSPREPGEYLPDESCVDNEEYRYTVDLEEHWKAIDEWVERGHQRNYRLTKYHEIYIYALDTYLGFDLNFEVLFDGPAVFSLILPDRVLIRVPIGEGNGYKRHELRVKDVESCSLLPSGHALLCLPSGTIQIYSLQCGVMTQSFQNEQGKIVAIHQQSRTSLEMYHFDGGKDLPALARGDAQGSVDVMCFSQDGKHLAIASSMSKKLAICSL